MIMIQTVASTMQTRYELLDICPSCQTGILRHGYRQAWLECPNCGYIPDQ